MGHSATTDRRQTDATDADDDDDGKNASLHHHHHAPAAAAAAAGYRKRTDAVALGAKMLTELIPNSMMHFRVDFCLISKLYNKSRTNRLIELVELRFYLGSLTDFSPDKLCYMELAAC